MTQWRERSYTQPIHNFITPWHRVEPIGTSPFLDITVVWRSITVSTLSIHHANQQQAMQTFPSPLTGRAHWQSWLMMHVWLYSAPDLPSPRHSTLLDHASCFSSVTPLLWIIPPQFFPGPSHICPVLWWRKCILRSIKENRLSSWYRLGRSKNVARLSSVNFWFYNSTSRDKKHLGCNDSEMTEWLGQLLRWSGKKFRQFF